MNENGKKIVLVVVAVAALAVAGLGAKSLFSGDKQEISRTLPQDPNFKSEKQQAIESEGKATPPSAEGEKDLSGALGG